MHADRRLSADTRPPGEMPRKMHARGQVACLLLERKRQRARANGTPFKWNAFAKQTDTDVRC